MKRALILIVLIALPALAQEQAPVQDSPLVAAAKRSKAAKKRAIVITNETLKQSGADAHVTTTKKQAALPAAQTVRSSSGAAGVSPPNGGLKAAAPQKSQGKPVPHDDAEDPYEENGGRGDLVNCPTCLPILEPVSDSLPLTKAEFAKNPPHVATPEPPPVVPPRVPEAPPR
jgi:hypothetical protein